MATKIGVAPDYFTSFIDGQGAGASTYTDYATDMDTNFVLLKTTINAIIDEVQAVNGTAALISHDLATLNDPAGPLTVQANGVLGAHSYVLSETSTTSVTVTAGQCIINNQRLVSNSSVLFSGLVNNDYWIALDAGGVPFIETVPAQRSLDVASFTVSGGVVDATTFEQLAVVFHDGDSMNDAVSRGNTGGWAAGAAGGSPLNQGVLRSGYKVFRGVADRIRAIERMVTGYATEEDGDTLPPHGFGPGAAATPSIALGDGAGTNDTTTGWFRPTANVWAFAVSAVEKFRLTAQGILASIDGTAAAPFFSRVSDPNTGSYFPGADRYGISTAGNAAVEVDALGNVDLIRQTRGEATATALSLADGTSYVSLVLDTEVRDIGGSFAASSADITAPTDSDGTWQMIVAVVFDESTIGGAGPNTGQRGVAIQWNGTTLSRVEVDAITVGDTALVATYEGNLSAAQVIRAQAYQNNDDNSACNVDVRVSWRKVA